MKPKPITLPDWQRTAIAEGRCSRITVPVEPQPSMEITRVDRGFKIRLEWGENRSQGFAGRGWTEMAIREEQLTTLAEWCPYQPGDALYCRERWWRRESDGVIVFDSDGALSFDQSSLAHRMGIGSVPCEKNNDELPSLGFAFHEAESLPEWAARTRARVTGVTAYRVADIDAADVDREGLPESEWSHVDGWRRDEYRAMWNESHPGYPFETAWGFALTINREN